MDDHKMEESGSEHLDRLSELPESLILHILSFLPMRDVVSTTLLSKRWENLWTSVPCLNFSDIVSKYDESDTHCVRNFVNRALICWKKNKLLKFTIDIDYPFDKSLATDMNLWVRFAVENKMQELNIRLEYPTLISSRDVFWAPQCLTSCSSMRKLSIVGCNLRIRGSPVWNQLMSLKLDGTICFDEGLINQILLGSPQLEVLELGIIETNNNLNIWSTSLKKLKIDKYIYFVYDELSLDTMLRICCPNLETLEFLGESYGKCLFTNVSSLTDATLGFRASGYYGAGVIELLGETMRHMFSTFQHVERVTLSSSSFQVLRASLKENFFSPLPNVVFFKVEAHLIELVEMVYLLGIFPNLKMLVIESCSLRISSDDSNAQNYSELETNLSRTILLQLKIIEFTSNFCDSSIFQCIEFLLKHGCQLEKLVIRVKCLLESHKQARMLEVAETLLSMPRSSTTARIIFVEN
ncbi:hypothetical protein ACS0TY_008687 [Phlomoides rotata]